MPVTIDGTTGVSAVQSGAVDLTTDVNGILPVANGGVGNAYGATNYTAFKNRIINGAMMIDQRNAGASSTVTSSGYYSCDRWQEYASQTSKYSVQQNAGSVTPPAGFTNYLGITSLSSYSVGAGDFFGVTQYIEGYNIADLAWGTANAQTVTVSFWVRSSLTGTFGGAIGNSGQSRSYPFTYTISSANTWEQKTITIAGDTTGTWLTTNGRGAAVYFNLGTGATYSGTANSWAAAQYFTATGATSVVGTNGATFYITGVQLEKGSTATSFDYRPYGQELVLCERYCQVISGASIGRTITGNIIGACYMFPVLFRAAPTATNITYTISTGATGTTATFGSTVNSIEFYNAANNWTAQALLQVSATLSAEL